MIELMLLLIAVGAGIVFVAWTNTRRRKQDVQDRREVEASTGKLKQELERTATEIIGRMENHVTHLEKVLDESERNRTQLEGRVTEMKKLLKRGESQAGEIRDLLARLDDAGEEMNSIQRKMDVVERKLNLAMTTPIQIQQPVTIPQMPPQQLMTPIISQPAPIAPIPAPIPKVTPPPVPKVTPQPAPVAPISPAPKVTTPPAEPINPLGPITMTPLARTATPEPADESPKPESDAVKDFDKILEETIADPLVKVDESARPQPRSSIILSPENKQPLKVVDADPVKIEATRKRLTEASAKMAANPPEEVSPVQEQTRRRKRAKGSRSGRDVRKAALDAIREAEVQSAVEVKPVEEPPKIVLPEKSKAPEKLPERRELKLETTDASLIKEMLLSGMSIEDIARETGLGRGAIELVQELTRRQLNRR